MAFVRVMDAKDVAEGRPAFAAIGDIEVAVFRIGDEVFALDDLCSHAQASLSEGEQMGNIVECPRHGGRFDIRTGKAKHFPAFSPVQTYRAKVEDDGIYVDVGEE